MNKVYILRSSVVSPLGNTNTDNFVNQIDGKHGISVMESHGVSPWKSKFCAKVTSKSKSTRTVDDIAKIAAENLVEDFPGVLSNARVIMGTAVGSAVELEYERRRNKLPDESFFSFEKAGISVSSIIKSSKKPIAVSTGCTAGLDAIGLAFDRLRLGFEDIVVAGASEATICEIVVASFDRINALSCAENCDSASIPFCDDRSGFVIGEGAGLVVMCTDKYIEQSGLEPIAEFLGWESISSNFHMTAIDQKGTDIATSITKLVKKCNVDPIDIKFVDTHGTSTYQNDCAEFAALIGIFGLNPEIHVTCQKSLNGHALGADSAIEIANIVEFIRNRKVPGYVNSDRVSSDFKRLPFTTKPKAVRDGDLFLKIANGFSGIHSTGLIRAL